MINLCCCSSSFDASVNGANGPHCFKEGLIIPSSGLTVMLLPPVATVDLHGIFIVEQRVTLMFPVILNTKLGRIKMRTKPSVWKDTDNLSSFIYLFIY